MKSHISNSPDFNVLNLEFCSHYIKPCPMLVQSYCGLTEAYKINIVCYFILCKIKQILCKINIVLHNISSKILIICFCHFNKLCWKQWRMMTPIILNSRIQGKQIFTVKSIYFLIVKLCFPFMSKLHSYVTKF